MKTIYFVVIFSAIQTSLLFAQLQRVNYPLLKQNGQAYRNAWAGGFNNPQFSEVDLNGDLIKDLLVFDRTGNVSIPFLNGGNASTIDYTFAPEFKSVFPNSAQLFVLLRDYNCDGIEDLFTYYKSPASGQAGLAVFRALRNVNGTVSYQLEKELLSYTEKGQTFDFNLYMSNIDLPDINDIDGDGDLDILNFHTGGGYVELFKNVSIENSWSCDSLKFVKEDDCWGRFYESGISVSLDLSPNVDSCSDWTGWQPLRTNNPNTALHAGSTILSLDMDNDGDKEILLGDISFNNFNLVINGGTADTAFATSQVTNFPANTTAVNITTFPAAFYLDIDNDGNKDLIASPNADDISVNDRVAWLYHNSQSNQFPIFNFEQQDFLVNEMLDVGSTAAPVFVDFNGDGLKDLVVGSYGLFVSTATYRTKIIAFENTGSLVNPVFRLTNQDFGTLQQYNLRRLVPTFADLNNDGDQDMIVGQEDGTLVYVINTGTNTMPFFATPISNFSGIDVGQNAAPQLFDVDKDGDFDLLIGERNGNINLFLNTGTVSSPIFASIPDNQAFGQIDCRVLNVSLEGNSAPFMYEDHGILKFFVGNESGEVWVYDSIENNLNGAFRRLSSDFDGIEEGRQSILAMANIDLDSLPELIVGNKRGGLALFKGSIPSSVELISEVEKSFVRIFPVPAKNLINIKFEKELSKDASILISNVLGERQFEIVSFDKKTLLQIDTEFLSNGVYFFSIIDNNKIYSEKFIIER